ncbi:Flp pilus assembly complex ATPase component TadA [bacterium]|nr:Flp pilus assembly complex ATPase component TadA [bacterium]
MKVTKSDKKKLGEILIENQIITPQQLMIALDLQKRRKQKLGRILVDLGLITEGTLTDVLSEQLKLKRIKLDLDKVDNKVLKLVSKDLCKKYRVLPYMIEGKSLILAMDDPLNVTALEVSEFSSGYDVIPALVTPAEMDNALEFLFSKTIESSETIDNSKEPPVSPGVKTLKEKKLTKEDISKYVNMLILEGIKFKASDIHIERDYNITRIRYRSTGPLFERHLLPVTHHDNLVNHIKTLAKMDISQKGVPQSGSFRIGYKGKEMNLRVETIPTINGENINLKIQSRDLESFEINHLGMNDQELLLLTKNIFQQSGLVIVSGPMDSGKTTTMYSILRKINSKKKKIITIEDHVELVLPYVNQIQIKPSQYSDYKMILHSIFRFDPDVIYISGIRDREVAEIAIRAASTGHLVLSCIDTKSSIEAIYKLIDLGVGEYFLMNNLNLVINQRLLNVLCPYCRSKVNFEIMGQKISAFKSEGCEKCGSKGFIGKTGIFEMLPGEVLKKGVFPKIPTSEELNNLIHETGVGNLWEKGLQKVKEGEISLNDLMNSVPHP